MASLNRVYLLGNLTQDPKLRELAGGASVADLTVAVNEKRKDKSGETIEKTCFVDVVAWDKLATICGEYLKKGSAVMVEGRLQQEQWKTPDGQSRSKMRVRADRVQFLGQPGKPDGDDSEAARDNGHGRDRGVRPTREPQMARRG
jgi:single-strand DNA-binding protein